MFENKKYPLKMFVMFASLIFIFNCDEDYVSSLSKVIPSISLETSSSLDNLYLGEEVDNLELILQVEDSPSISSIAVSVSYDSDNFQGQSISINTLSNQFFQNDDGSAQMLDCGQCPIQEGIFSINAGLHNNQDTEHANGDGEIARFYLSGKNIQTNFDVSIDEILSYDFPEFESVGEWVVEDLSIGAPVPDIFFNNFVLTDNRLSLNLSVSDLPKATSSQITITYDSDILNFIDYSSPIKGSLTGSFDLFHPDSGGEIMFAFTQQDGSNSYTGGDGSLVVLEFDVLDLSQSSLSFTANFNEATYDVCGGCDSPLYSEHYDYDVSFWGTLNTVFEFYGCTDLGANNYNENAIFDNGTCEYDSQEPEQVGG